MAKIGIIYSPGFGAGWSTWGESEMALDQELAKAIDERRPFEEIIAIAEKNWPDEHYGGLDDSVVMWVDEGTEFRIEEYDGSERVVFSDSFQVSRLP